MYCASLLCNAVNICLAQENFLLAISWSLTMQLVLPDHKVWGGTIRGLAHSQSFDHLTQNIATMPFPNPYTE